MSDSSIVLQLGSPSLAKPNYQALKVDHVLHDTLSHFMATRASTFAVGDALDDEPDSLFSSLSKGTTWFKQTLASVSLLRKFCASRLSSCVLTVILLSAPSRTSSN